MLRSRPLASCQHVPHGRKEHNSQRYCCTCQWSCKQQKTLGCTHDGKAAGGWIANRLHIAEWLL